jgi:hypothetical protein
MLFKGMLIVYPAHHMKPIRLNTLCVQNAKLLNVKADGNYIHVITTQL